MLLKVKKLRNNQSGTAQCRVAARYRSSHNAKYSQCTAKHAEPSRRHGGYHLRCLKRKRHAKLLCGSTIKEIRRYCCPYKRNDALGYHRTVKQRTSLFLIRHTTCHKRTLSGMEAADGTTGNGYKKTWEYRARFRRQIAKSVGKLWQLRPFDKQHHHERNSHKQHGNGKSG